MNLMAYDPFRELRSLQEEVNRVFAGANRGGQMNGGWNPSVDIYENKEQLVIEAELPGLSPDDVDVSVENNVLTIHGERKFEKTDEGDNFHRIERSYGSFTRSFTLPPTISSEGIDASFENGILRLELTKREDAKPRRIEIRGGEGRKTIEANARTQSAG